ncbi:MAG: ABC transporter substrate-binding protein [Candidatus Kryptoniota bacterium]
MIKATVLINILIFLLGSADAQIQFRPADETHFALGLQSFREGDYSAAYQHFKQIIIDSLNQRSAEAYYYGARSLFNLKRFKDVEQLADSFFVLFSTDPHYFEMEYILGAADYELAKYNSASLLFVSVIDSAGESPLIEKAASSLQSIVATNLSFDEIEKLFSICRSSRSAEIVTVGFVRRAYFSDKASLAFDMLNEFVQKYPYAVTGEVKGWLNRLALEKEARNANLKIGAVLPLEYGSGVGDKLMLGIQLALDEYNRNARPRVGLRLENYSGDLSKLDEDIRALADDSNIKAIVGPVFSGEVGVAAPIVNSLHVPLITPTATQVGLAPAGSYVFQANPDFKIRGEVMAEFAVNVLHLKRIAVLSPSESYGKIMAGYFISKLNELGIKPISVAYFESGTTDLSQQIAQIKNDAARFKEPYVEFGELNKYQISALKSYGLSPSLVDSLVRVKGTMDAYDIFGKDADLLADSLGIPITERTALTQFDALRSLEAIFIPLTSSRDIGIIGAQLAYYNVKTQLLGTDDWYDMNHLTNNVDYVDGVIFCSDTYLDASSPQFRSISDTLSQISDKEFDRTVAYGYDVTNMLLQLIRSGNLTREELKASLQNCTYRGIHSIIGFSGGNTNKYMNILQFRKGTVIKLAEVKSN